jgi:hypothetical protein
VVGFLIRPKPVSFSDSARRRAASPCDRVARSA